LKETGIKNYFDPKENLPPSTQRLIRNRLKYLDQKCRHKLLCWHAIPVKTSGEQKDAISVEAIGAYFCGEPIL